MFLREHFHSPRTAEAKVRNPAALDAIVPTRDDVLRRKINHYFATDTKE